MPEVALVGPADYERIASFLAAFPGDKGSVQSWLTRFHAWWEGNPAFTPDASRGWILRDGETIVGFVGEIPTRLLVDSAESIAIGGSTWRVLPEHRGMSMQLKSRTMATHRDAVHFAMTPSPQVAAMLKLFRYHPIQRWQEDGRQSVVVLNLRKFLRPRLAAKHLGALLPLCLPLARLAQAWVLRRLPRAEAVRELADAGAAFDDLWERSKHAYRNTNVRTAATIRWFCFENRAAEKKLLGYFRGEALLGFIILFIEHDADVSTARCVDLWLDPAEDDTAIVGALVTRALAWAKSAGLDRAVFPHFHRKVAECYARLGLPCRPSWNRREFLAAPEAILRSMTPENTYLVGAQGDLGL